MSFFEKTRKSLFPKVSEDLGAKLFAAYADIHRPEAAVEFWQAYAKKPDSDLKMLRQVTVAAEALTLKLKGPWGERDRAFQKDLVQRAWAIRPEKLAVGYFERMQQTTTADGHVGWMYSLAKHFGEADGTYICDLEYPLLSKMSAKGDQYKQVGRRPLDRASGAGVARAVQTR